MYLVTTPDSATYLYTRHQEGEKISKGSYRDDFLVSLLKLTLIKHPHGKHIPSLYGTAGFFHSFYIQVPAPYHKMLSDVCKSSECLNLSLVWFKQTLSAEGLDSQSSQHSPQVPQSLQRPSDKALKLGKFEEKL